MNDQTLVRFVPSLGKFEPNGTIHTTIMTVAEAKKAFPGVKFDLLKIRPDVEYWNYEKH